MADPRTAIVPKPAAQSANMALLVLLLGCAGALLAAHAFERFGGFAPCSLCLRQREVYWVIGGLLIGFLALNLSRPDALRARVFLALAAIGLMVGAGQAFWHAGVEWKFWPGPATCGGGSSGTIPSGREILAALEGGIRAVPCDEAAWRLAGISMAGWNGLYSLVLALFALFSLRRGFRKVRVSEHSAP